MRAALLALITLAYPLLVYFGLGRFEPRWMALVLVVLALARAIATRERMWWVASIGALILAGFSMAGNHLLPLKLYPVLVNSVLLAVFATSLFHPPTVIERLARLQEPDLPPEGIAYTRRVTQVWCAFFVFNGTTALVTAIWASNAVWTLYNGLLSYVMMGCLFAGEWLVRQRVKARQRHA